MSQILPTYLVDKDGGPIEKTNPLEVKATFSGALGSVDQGASNADAAKGWSTRITDGASFITPAKTGQFPTALGATTAAGSLGVGIATDQLSMLATQTTADATLAQIDAKTSTLATATKQDTSNTSLATIATTQTDGNQKTQVTNTVNVTGPLTDAQLRAVAVPISAAALPLPSGAATSVLQGAGLPATLVGGKLDVNLGTSSITLPVSGPLTDAQLRATPLPVSGTTIANQGTGASAAVPWSVELSTGSAFYTGAKTEQFPTTLGQTTKANSLSVALASDTTLPLPSGAATSALQGAGLPSALVGGRLDTNLGAWLGSTTPTVGRKTAANSVPIVIASDVGTVTDGTNTAAVTAGSVVASYASAALTTAARPTPSFRYITAANTTTTVKASAGVIRSVEITAPLTAGSLTVYNANGTATDPIAGFGASISGVFLRDLVCANGITVITGIGFNGQVTVTYE